MTTPSLASLRAVTIIGTVAIVGAMTCLIWVLPPIGDAAIAGLVAAVWALCLDRRNRKKETR
jgi:hypothetical protein